jgi:hypothetical protein
MPELEQRLSARCNKSKLSEGTCLRPCSQNHDDDDDFPKDRKRCLSEPPPAPARLEASLSAVSRIEAKTGTRRRKGGRWSASALQAAFTCVCVCVWHQDTSKCEAHGRYLRSKASLHVLAKYREKKRKEAKRM